MNTSIFRKASLDRVNSPEQLNDYIRVSNPGVWLILSAIILLLAGVIVWGMFGSIETTLTTGIKVENGSALCYVSTTDASKIKVGQTVSVDDQKGIVTDISRTPVKVDESFDDYVRYLSGFSEGDYCYAVEVSISGVDDGIHSATITIDRISPLSFVIN